MLKEHVGLVGEVLAVLEEHYGLCELVVYGEDDLRRLYGRCTCAGRKRTTTHRWKNLITDAGDQHYAEIAAIGRAATVPSLANAFTTLELANDAGGNAAPAKGHDRSDMVTIIAGSEKLITAGYPRVSDPDPQNTGAGADILTWQFHYTTGDFNAVGISDAWITNPSPGASEPILNHADEGTSGAGFAAVFTKTANQTLKMIFNHELRGV